MIKNGTTMVAMKRKEIKVLMPQKGLGRGFLYSCRGTCPGSLAIEFIHISINPIALIRPDLIF